jgi:hypothetical protein
MGTLIGLLVAGLGIMLLFGRSAPDLGRWIPLVVGLVFLAAFLTRRVYGFLVAGSIITGVGVGALLAGAADTDLAGAVATLCLAAGFLAIWVLGSLIRVPQNHRWPFIPGGILAMAGMIALADAELGGVARWWPLILVAIGVAIVARALVPRRG